MRLLTKTSALLEDIFEIKERGSSVSIEVLGGVVHFMGIFSNLIVTASILEVGGLPIVDGVTGGAWAGCFGQLLVGLLSNLPIAVSAGAGPNVTVAYLLAQSIHVGGLGSYGAALTTCFCAGLLIVILTAVGAISRVTNIVPSSLKSGICAGIGLLCAFVGFQRVGIVVRSPEGLIGPGDFSSNAEIWLSLSGLVALTVMISRRIQGAFFVTMVAVTVIDWTFLHHWPVIELQPLKLPKLFVPDVGCLHHMSFWMQVFAMTLMLVFDLMGCLFSLAKLAERFDVSSGSVQGGNGMFYAVGLGTSFSALFGLSPMVVSGNAAAAINDGARTGLCTCISGVLLLVVGLPCSSLLSEMPACTSSFVLIYSGVTMFSDTAQIDWSDPIASVPAFLCICSQPFLFSIADGIYMGLASALLLNLLTGRMGSPSSMSFMLFGQAEEAPAIMPMSSSPDYSPEQHSRRRRPVLLPNSPGKLSLAEFFSPASPRALSIAEPQGGKSRNMSYYGTGYHLPNGVRNAQYFDLLPPAFPTLSPMVPQDYGRMNYAGSSGSLAKSLLEVDSPFAMSPAVGLAPAPSISSDTISRIETLMQIDSSPPACSITVVPPDSDSKSSKSYSGVRTKSLVVNDSPLMQPGMPVEPEGHEGYNGAAGVRRLLELDSPLASPLSSPDK